MDKNNHTSQAFGPLVSAAAFVVVVAGMRAAQPILEPCLLAAFVAVISAPPLFWLQRKGLPTAVAMLLVIGAVAGMGLILATLVGKWVFEFSQALPVYQERLTQMTSDLFTWLENWGVPVADKKPLEYVDPAAVMGMVANVLGGLGGLLSNAFMILLTVVFILLEAASFPLKLRSIASNPDASMQRFGKIIDHVKQYVAIKTWVSLATGIIVAVWLAVVGVDFPLLWGLVAFLFNYVPAIGSILAAIPAVLLALVQLGVGSALWAMLGYLLVNMVIGNVIEPRVQGRGVGLSALVVFVSMVFWGWLLGPVGMLLSVPLTMVLKVAMESSPDTHWVAVLLGSEPPPQEAVVAIAPSPEPKTSTANDSP